MKIADILEQLLDKNNLSADSMRAVMRSSMQGELTDAQIAAFLVLMRAKGETVEELTTAAEVMLEFAHIINLGDNLVDIVGTGGDGKNTFNISTASSIVASAAGAKIAKHGNRSVSSRSGSADLLLEIGIALQLDDQQLKLCMERYHLCFLFAPHFHQTLQQVRNARQQLGIRSFFNLLGPLVNPARIKNQVVGVFDKRWQKPLAEVLVNLGSERVIMVTSRDGLDEASVASITDILEFHQGNYKQWSINPADYGLHHPDLNPLVVDSSSQSLHLVMSVLEGKPGPARDIVILNSALALYCNDVAKNLEVAIDKSIEAIDSGMALKRLQQIINFSNQPS